MPIRIRERICRLRADYPRAVALVEGWTLLALMLGGSFAAGHIAGLSRADVQIAQSARDHQAEQQRLMDINRQLMLIIEQRLPAIAETASGAAEAAKAAADTANEAALKAGSAGRTARTAASTAKQAATTAGAAAQAVEDAVTPVPSVPADAPKWLDGP